MRSLASLLPGHGDALLLVARDVDADDALVPEPRAQIHYLQRPLRLCAEAAQDATDLEYEYRHSIVQVRNVRLRPTMVNSTVLVKAQYRLQYRKTRMYSSMYQVFSV